MVSAEFIENMYQEKIPHKDYVEMQNQMCEDMNRNNVLNGKSILYKYNENSGYIDKLEIKEINKEEVLEFVLFRNFIGIDLDELLIELYEKGYVIESNDSFHINLMDFMENEKMDYIEDESMRCKILNTSDIIQNILNTHLTYNIIRNLKYYKPIYLPSVIMDHIMILFKTFI